MTGRDMDKAVKDTIRLMVVALIILGVLVSLIMLLPKNPMPREFYMTDTEMLVSDILALGSGIVLVLIGMILGRYLEARQYQKNGRYLGKRGQ